jgi:hypothetical protein
MYLMDAFNWWLYELRVPEPIEHKPEYEVRDGILHGPGVFYCPTNWKFYKRPDDFVDHPVSVVLHYTACRASVRKITDLPKLIRKAEAYLDNEDGEIDQLYNQLCRLGEIPDAVSLTLQNAAKSRKASWCLCIGAEPLPDGLIPVVQYSPHLGRFGTWHAGSPATWEMRKPKIKGGMGLSGRTFNTSRGETRWDGRNYRWPEVTNPETGIKKVLSNSNHYTIGVEAMNVGPYGAERRLKWPGLPRGVYGGKTYEKPSTAHLDTLSAVTRALRDEYGDLPVWGHSDLVPWSKRDPAPPYSLDI